MNPISNSILIGNPLLQNFPESYTIDQFVNTMVGVDFLGIKVGDVNDNVVANELTIVEDRTVNTVNFVTPEQSLVAGKTYAVPFTAENFRNMLAYQYTVEFNNSALSYVGFENAALDLDESNFGLHEVKNGKITTSWNDIEGQNIEGTLFTLVFTAQEDAMLSDVLKFGFNIDSCCCICCE